MDHVGKGKHLEYVSSFHLDVHANIAGLVEWNSLAYSFPEPAVQLEVGTENSFFHSAKRQLVH